ncbi:uncharacterized protein LOC126982975 [Eriocheir sinensis]|uniref:uncharacterized protein LOC126982975 n=1 Tax=Eriocheir sinensis TaxID=95602 RepID=UPI0021C8D545|nr:uncharacterized protein LOC126982975 [Eriocheir sinensis]
MTKPSILHADRSSPRWVPSMSTLSPLPSCANRRYTPEQYRLALKAVCEDGLTAAQAGALHGVPKSTIWHRLYASKRSSSSTPARKTPYPLRRHAPPGDSSRSKNSPYHFRQQRTSELTSLAKHGKSATSSQEVQQKNAGDTSRRKVSGRNRDRSGLGIGGDDACCFCGSAEDDELMLGKMFVLRKFRMHYFCLLFASGLPQNGDDDEGILGFLEEDIKAEILRGRKLAGSQASKIM